MQNEQYNSDFYSYQGYINRKNYSINMLILVSLFVLVQFINVDVLFPNQKYQIINDILDFMIRLFQFVVLFSGVSTVYRRIADISKNQSENFKSQIKRAFALLFVFPILYFFAIRYFFASLTLLINSIDLITLFIISPVAIISSIIIAFIKGK